MNDDMISYLTRLSWRFRAGVFAMVMIVAFGPSSGHAQSSSALEREPDDALPRDRRRLVTELTNRDMPELVEELLSDAPLMHRIYIARAYAKAAGGSKDSEERQRFLEKSAAAYRQVTALSDNEKWYRGLRRRFDVAQWKVELADLLLRHLAAPDLDRFEATSGLDFDRPRLIGLLREAHRVYLDAGRRLDELLVDLRTQERRFLLLGLADKITSLADVRRLNAAWADVYLAMVDDQPAHRSTLLDSALTDFDFVSRTARDPERKYNALVGAGVALRESDRYAEAIAAFDRVRLSTASTHLIVRARFEEARAHLRARHFDEARRELAELEQRSSSDTDDSARYYVRLAPMILAYCDLQESSTLAPGGARQAALREKAVGAFNDLAKQGGPWTSIARAYLDRIQASHHRLDDLSNAELSLNAARLMTEEKYDQAIESLRMLLSRRVDGDRRLRNEFNLAVCYFQTGDLHAAVDHFESLAKNPESGDLMQRATLYAYDCRRKIASSEKNVENYKRLAEAANDLAERFSANENAKEARWIAALAYQEAGQLTLAIAAYERIPSGTPDHKPALQGIAVCRQRLYDELSTDASRERRRRVARAAVDAWKTVARAFEGTNPPPTTSSSQYSTMEEANLAAARILAGPDLSSFDEAMAILRTLAPSDRTILFQLQCLRGQGDDKNARREFDELLRKASAAQRGRVLTALALQLEKRSSQLDAVGQREQAQKSWRETADVVRELLGWLSHQTGDDGATTAARSCLARSLAGSGDTGGALAEYDRLIAGDPTNGGYLRDAARLCEELARRGDSPDTAAAADRAENYWARLLRDGHLRERSPAVYWEARYSWLAHQLRHGRAADVWKGIESERAWYPDLGGPPWQGRLIELAKKARELDGHGNR